MKSYERIAVSIKASLDKNEAFRLKEILGWSTNLEITRAFALLKPGFQKQVLESIPVENAAKVLSLALRLRIPLRQLFERLDPSFLAGIISICEPDDAKDLMALLTVLGQQAVKKNLTAKFIEEIDSLTSYVTGTAGSLMNPRVSSLQEEQTVEQALQTIRETVQTNSIFYLYVTDKDGVLTGIVSLRSLVLAPPHDTVKSITSKEILSIYAHQSLDEILEVFEKADYLAIPVVSKSGKLLGMISRDNVLQRKQDDTEDDLFRLNRVNPEEFRGAPLLRIIPFRLPWLIASMFGGLLNALILSHYTKLLEVVIILSLYIPVLLGLAETVATQTSTLIIRGIETGQLASIRFRQMLFKEIFVGLLLGFISGVILGILTYLWTGMANIGMILTFSVCLSVTIASIFGTVIPLVMKALKFDPAVASSPFILSGSDICAISIYLYTAALMLSNRG